VVEQEDQRIKQALHRIVVPVINLDQFLWTAQTKKDPAFAAEAGPISHSKPGSLPITPFLDRDSNQAEIIAIP
jgi:hypothetical protein